MGKYNKEYSDYYKKINLNEKNEDNDRDKDERRYNIDDEYGLRHMKKTSNKRINHLEDTIKMIGVTTIIPTILFSGIFLSKGNFGEQGNKVYKHIKEAISTSGYYEEKIELALAENFNIAASGESSLSLDADIDKNITIEKELDKINVDKEVKENESVTDVTTSKKEDVKILSDKTYIEFLENLKGVEIKAKSETGLVLKCRYKIVANGVAGIVKTTGENAEGHFILIEHADGIETAYYNLPSVDFEEGEAIKKGDKITEIKEESEIVFKISKDEEYVSPMKYFDFIS